MLGRFLADRKSEDPMVEKPLFSEDGKFEWGYAQPLEKVISAREDFEFLATHPQLFRNAITIAEFHVRLLRKAVAEVLSMESLENDTTGDALPFIQDVCKKISAVGEDLPIIKRDGRVVAQGWNDPQFAVVRNEEKEIGVREAERSSIAIYYPMKLPVLKNQKFL
ncbi:MAG: hypothetical protein F6K48_28885 [Okeania sp. SIO3H1]|nr:hypothetical protein [Okeania sp. SIO3H1]